jgi:excisionase family DNA binding protein
MKDKQQSIEVPDLLTIKQVAKKLNLGMTKVYEMIKYDALPTMKFGRSTRVHPEQLVKWLDKRIESDQAA